MEMKVLKQIVEYAGPGRFDLYFKDGRKAYAYKKDGKIDDAVLEAHLAMQPIGINMNRPSDAGPQTHFLVFDFDDHDGTKDPNVMRTRVGIVVGALEREKVPYICARSGGGKGYHIWVVYEQATRADSILGRAESLLKAANTILHQFWPHETFCAELDGEKAGMFIDTGNLHSKNKRENINKVEHRIEVLPKGSGTCNVALPLAQKSVLLMVERIDADGIAALTEHSAPETVDLVLAKKRAPGPKTAAAKEVDVTAAFAAVKKLRGSLDGYKKWLACGFMLRAAFGEDGLDMLIEWSRESDGFVSDDDVRKKWEKDICAPDATKCPKEAFWAYARNGGYTGGLPDGIALAKSNTTKVILDDVVGSLKLFRDGDGTAYARVGPRRVLRIDSLEFSDWLRRAAYESGTTPSQEQISLVVATARAHAYDNIEDVHLRVAKVGGEIFVDLCDADDRVLMLSAHGARFIEGEEACPVVFRRSRQLPLRYAEGDLDDIRAMVNMDDDQFIIFMACAVKMFFPDTPSPIVNLTGEYGSAKTSTTRVMRSLIDPVTAMVAKATKNEDDLLIRSWHNYVLTLENMSDLTPYSDTLCGICTGMGFEVRQLFTNGDLFSIYVRRAVVVNGIDPSKYAADLISRIVGITLEKPEKRMLESEFEAALLATAPKMFGGIARLVVEVLKVLPEIDPHEFADNIRLAEFGAVGEAVARVMGKEPMWFIEVMMEMQSEAQDEAADDSMTMQALEAMQEPVARHGKFWGESQELLLMMKQAAETRGLNVARLPMTAATLSREMNQLKPALRKRGWTVEKKSRKWLIVPPSDPSEEQLMAMVGK